MNSQIVGVRFSVSAVEALERMGAGRGERSALVRASVMALLAGIEESAKRSAKEWQVPSFPLRRSIVVAIASGEPVEVRLSRSRRWLAVVAAPDGLAWRTFAGSRAFEVVHGFPLTWTVAERMSFGLRFALEVQCQTSNG